VCSTGEGKGISFVGFEVLMAVSIKMAVFWVAVLCRLMTEAVQTSEKLVNLYQSTQHYNPKGNHFPGISFIFP
jgi:hypothetical protein